MRIDRPEHYYRVSLERLKQSWFLSESPEHESYALAMYVAGVAVESMLRAFKMFRDPVFDEKHVLSRPFRAGGMLDLDPEILKVRGFTTAQVERHFQELQAAASDVCDLWENDYRFASEERMRARLESKQLDRGVKGDFSKKKALDLLQSSQRIIDKEVFQWGLLRRSTPS
jgi:hypothetical protein